MINFEDISVIVQGVVAKENTPVCLKSIRTNMLESEIILSTWIGSNVEGLDYDVLVLNEDPGACFCNKEQTIKNNLNRQLVSTQSGLKKANRKYILKLRSDLILTSSSFLDFFNEFPNRNEKYKFFKNRVIVSTMFSRESIFCDYRNKEIPLPLAPSDWWFFGLNEDVKKYFDVPLVTEPEFSQYFLGKNIPDDYTWQFTPEQYLGKFLLKQENLNCEMIDTLNFSKSLINVSKHIMTNNFIFLGHNESGIYAEKYMPYSKDERLFDFRQYNGLITYLKFLENYKKCCASSYNIPASVLEYYKKQDHHYNLNKLGIMELLSNNIIMPFEYLWKKIRGIDD